jgi:hypothetical protein
MQRASEIGGAIEATRGGVQYHHWQRRKRVIIGVSDSFDPSAGAPLAQNLADEGISPGLVLWGQGRNTGDRIVQALSIVSGLIGTSQHGLNVEHNLWIRSGQRQPDARHAFAQTSRQVDAHEVVIRPMRADCPFRNGQHMGASPQQVDLDEMRGALPHLGLLGHIR